jgi:hypothetical protein
VERTSQVSVRKYIRNNPEYLLRIEAGKRNVFGVKGDQLEPIDCPLIIARVLGGRDVKFPIRVGLAWSDRRTRQIPGSRPVSMDYKYEVKSWEKVQTPKGEFDAFKIVRVLPHFTSKRAESRPPAKRDLFLCPFCEGYCSLHY